MITETELQKLQKLSKLSFSKEELDNFTKKMNIVIKMIDTLKDVDCTGVQPLMSVCDMQQRFREDEITVSNINDQLFENVPSENSAFAKEVKCFIVPKMVE